MGQNKHKKDIDDPKEDSVMQLTPRTEESVKGVRNFLVGNEYPE